ncbi:MAG: hypothetical protein AMK75_05370 [Planctomycetes bacterium SM23_65]|nr:MAG: hypothetical protein AMK75_05370 [Planctomycetes bacterium SM23_65]
MRTLCVLSGVVVVCLVLSSVAAAVTAGPGGRLYITYRAHDGQTPRTYYVHLQSLKINTDWTIDLEGRAPCTYNEHGLLVDNYSYGSSESVCGISPEIYSRVGEGFGAKLVMGLFYNNTPDNCYSTGQTMDVLEVTTADGSHSVNILGDGMGAPDAAPTWAGGWYGQYPSTERGYFAAPDPQGGFTGDGQNCYLTSGYDRYRYAVSVNTDTHGDGDITDNVGDYLDYVSQNIDSERDHEILGNKLFISSTYNTWMPETHGIAYYQRDPNTITRHAYLWRDDNIMTQWQNPDGGPNQGFHPVCSGLAATRLPDENGVYHDAVFTLAQTGWDQLGAAPTGYNSYMHIALCVDWNDDGDAMDNDLGEIRYVYSTTSANNGVWDDPFEAGYSDIELLKREGLDNGMFLICQQTSASTDVGYWLLVVELQPNGYYVGGDNGVQLLLQTHGTGWDYFWGSIEIDAIPEPTSLLLVSSGALGMLSCIRRRRMK